MAIASGVNEVSSYRRPADPPVTALLVRLTHWMNTAAVLALLVSGCAILLAHPRLYWGETGAYGSPALIELPLSLNLDQSGWGRSLHFLAAWVCIINGLAYSSGGLASGHFRRQVFAGTNVQGGADQYSVAQRVTYMAVIFALFPLMILTGLAMSPAVNAAVPVAGLFGGHQSARTLHFVFTMMVSTFFIVHVFKVYRAGFADRLRRMIAG